MTDGERLDDVIELQKRSCDIYRDICGILGSLVVIGIVLAFFVLATRLRVGELEQRIVAIEAEHTGSIHLRRSEPIAPVMSISWAVGR